MTVRLRALMIAQPPATLVNVRLRNDRLSWRDIQDGVVALDLESSSYFSANPSGALLMKRLADSDVTLQDLTDALVAEYGIDREKAQSDVLRFVALLESQDLLVTDGTVTDGT